jgi:hypothetical protein
MRAIILALTLLATVLAGCSSGPPSGEFSTDRHNVQVDGSADVAFHAGNMPYPNAALCPPDNPNLPPQLRCSSPRTTVSGHFMVLREPSPAGYTLHWVNDTGALEITTVVFNETGNMWDVVAQDLEGDYSGYTGIELRMGELVIATSGNSNGPNAFAANPDLTRASASGTWKGKDLTVTVSGLAANATYTGYLYEKLEDGSVVQADGMSFPINGNGEYQYTAAKNINKYAEFHIHIAGSSWNVAQATIE